MTRRAVSLTAQAVVFAVLVVFAADVLLLIFAGILFAVFLRGGGSFLARHTGHTGCGRHRCILAGIDRGHCLGRHLLLACSR